MDILRFLNVTDWSEGQAMLTSISIILAAAGWLFKRALAPLVAQIKEVAQSLTKITDDLVELTKSSREIDKRVSIHDVQIKTLEQELKELK